MIDENVVPVVAIIVGIPIALLIGLIVVTCSGCGAYTEWEIYQGGKRIETLCLPRLQDFSHTESGHYYKYTGKECVPDK